MKPVNGEPAGCPVCGSRAIAPGELSCPQCGCDLSALALLEEIDRGAEDREEVLRRLDALAAKADELPRRGDTWKAELAGRFDLAHKRIVRALTMLGLLSVAVITLQAITIRSLASGTRRRKGRAHGR